jgi:hypothetical protein
MNARHNRPDHPPQCRLSVNHQRHSYKNQFENHKETDHSFQTSTTIRRHIEESTKISNASVLMMHQREPASTSARAVGQGPGGGLGTADVRQPRRALLDATRQSMSAERGSTRWRSRTTFGDQLYKWSAVSRDRVETCGCRTQNRINTVLPHLGPTPNRTKTATRYDKDHDTENGLGTNRETPPLVTAAVRVIKTQFSMTTQVLLGPVLQ